MNTPPYHKQGKECTECGVTEWNADHKFKTYKQNKETIAVLCHDCDYAYTCLAQEIMEAQQ